MAITPNPLIGFASEYMRWKALLRGFPLDGVLSTTTHDTYQKKHNAVQDKEQAEEQAAQKRKEQYEHKEQMAAQIHASKLQELEIQLRYGGGTGALGGGLGVLPSEKQLAGTSSQNSSSQSSVKGSLDIFGPFD
jgi:sortase (surface protein transpeptidase)